MLVISVPSFEEQTDSSGALVTFYIVNVEDSTTGMKYTIIKRYSAFSNLKDNLKDVYPELDNFRFPHKSMFNTHSKFTKDRRRQGFDDFLKMLTTIRPMPSEFEEFLELREHIARFEKISRQNIAASAPQGRVDEQTPVPSLSSQPMLPTATAPKNAAQSIAQSRLVDSSPMVQAAESSRPKIAVNPNSREPQLLHEFRTTTGFYEVKVGDQSQLSEQEILLEIRKVTPQLLKSTYTWTVLCYLILVYLRIIDVSSTSVGKLEASIHTLGLIHNLIELF
jgi:hypothetical protein